MSILSYRYKGKKMKFLLLISFVTSLLFSTNIKKPDKKYVADGAVIEIVYQNGRLYCATTASSVDIIDTATQKIVQKITVPKIKDFMGDIIDAKIYSVDVLNNSILLLSQAEHGYRKVDIVKDNKTYEAIGVDKKLYIAKAKFLDKDTILIALLSNDIISYDIKKKKYNWSVQASQSKFSNFVLKEDKSEVVVADESGNLHILNTTNGELLKILSGQNLDNVFQVDYKNGVVASAGQDRRVVVYDLTFNSAYYKKAPFIVYSVGLSPSAKLAAYSSDENNNVTLFKRSTKSKLGVYGGNKMTLNKILFINEKEFFVSSDDKAINYYKIK